AMGANKITGVADPSAAQEAATKAYVDSQNSGKIGGTLTATRIPFASGASTLTDDSALIWDNTNKRLGIGTATPSYRLHVPWVSGDSVMTSYFGSGNASNNQIAVKGESYSGLGVYGASISSVGVAGSSTSSIGVSGETTSGNGVEGTSYGAGGGVSGVAVGAGFGTKGTSASGYGVHGVSNSSYGGFFTSSSVGNSTAVLVSRQFSSASADLFQAQNSSGTPLVNITSAGNVGIGNSSPGALLDVTKNQNAATMVSVSNSDTTNATSSAIFRAQNGSVQTVMSAISSLGGFVGTASNDKLGLLTNSATRVTVDASGNVGFGTTSPLDPVSIGTAVTASATRALVNLSNTALSGGSANGTYIGANPAAFTGNFIDLQVGGVSRFRVSNAGVISGDGSGLTGISGALSGLTAGGVPYATGATALATDNSNFSWDSTNKRLGIGTAAPASPIDATSATATYVINATNSKAGAGYGIYGNASGATGVNTGVYGYAGSSNSQAIGVWGRANAGYGVFGQSNSGNSGYFYSNSSANTSATLVTQQNGASTADLFQALTAGSSTVFSIDSWGSYYSTGGKIGSGAQRAARLTVRDAGTTWSILGTFAQDDANTKGLSVLNETYSTTEDNGLTFWQTNTGVGRISSAGAADPAGISIATTGNVGIGTTAPTEKLTINNGKLRLENDSLSYAEFFTASSTDWHQPKFRTFRSRGTMASPAAVSNGDELGGFDFHAYQNGGWQSAGGIGLAAEGVPSGNNVPTSMGFATNNGTTYANRMVIAGNGNVGIGTTSPGALLQLGTAGTSLGTMRLTGNTSGYVQIQPAAAAGSWNLTLPPNAGTSGYVLQTDGAGVTTWVAASGGSSSGTAGHVQFSNGSSGFSSDSNKLFWDSTNDRLGIGTSSPSKDLSIYGGNPAFSLTNTTFTDLRIWADSSGASLDAGGGALIFNTGASLGFANSERMRITQTGNIGIGTTNPSSKLQLEDGSVMVIGTGTTDRGYALAHNSAANSVWGMLASNVSGAFYLLDGEALTMPIVVENASPSNLLYLRNNGNVGIGTSSPTAGLHNAKAGAASTPAERIDGTWFAGGTATTTKPQLLIEPSGTTSNAWSTSGTGLGLNAASGFAGKLVDMQVNASTVFEVVSDGSVGTIGGYSSGNLGYTIGGNVVMQQGGSGILNLYDGSATSFSRINMGPATSSFPALAVSGSDLRVIRADNSTSANLFVSGGVGVGVTSLGASNLVELSSTTKGLVIPRMTKTQRNAIGTPVAGMMVYQTDNTPGLRVYNGTNWMRFTETSDP
ncbi:MAG: hypothetical protein K2X47_05425, partial [Bdellovibrionales bacterium]|nr:hypothetical protein [Bdellovibrionales bacterium]